MPTTTVTDINKILSAKQLVALRAGFTDPAAQKKFKTKMGGLLPSLYAGSTPLLAAVGQLFHDGLPADDAPPPRDLLSVRDRERCIIALLAGREMNSNIALHMYIALMEEVSPAEIAHILLLAGIYSGIPSFADGIQMEERLLRFLADRFDLRDPTVPKKPLEADLLFDDLRATLDADDRRGRSART
jgi:alkylhydroperoxidase/carboxymuconolactone decarboxylase family protein YurZ